MPQSNSNIGMVYTHIDREYQRYLDENPTLSERWLLAQTIHSREERRLLYQFLPLADGACVLDVGTGFAPIALELAAYKQVDVHAIDLNQTTLEVAENIYNRLIAVGAFQAGSRIIFKKSNIYEMPFRENSFDLIFARYVFQHLNDPQLAAAQIARMLKPGGYVCLVDVDDEFSLTYPETSDSFKRLQLAFGSLQEQSGGDRFVGRKLATYLHGAGLEVVSTMIQPQAQFGQVKQDDIGLQLTISRLHDVRQQIIELGIMGANEFDACLETFRQEAEQWQFHAVGQMVVVARK